MAKAKAAESKCEDQVDSVRQKSLPSFAEFREAVKHVLTHDHGMPPLCADELLDGDPEFVERYRQKTGQYNDDGQGAIVLAAHGLRFEAPSGLKWVALKKGQRVADEDDVVMRAEGSLGKYLDRLVEIGLHGADRSAVAASMLSKGIESVFPLIMTAAKK
ncbi:MULTISPECIES: hypothetical protein [Herbaspirillum]|uniref:Uncharacterized protein n=2 Tax=Herbaspirillum huttiense TaxID=863372 RepID=A0AAJ2LS99_9BURK|nr:MULTISPECIES: hypothetical protein [Herbaspirillum]MDR9836944.1 hypothetical protein [Herbaspirillum huttiense]